MKSLSLVIFFFLTTNAFAQLCPAYTDAEIVEAIFRAEGGDKAKPYYYGIRSVKCDSKDDCRRICLNTVKNNRKRFNAYGKSRHRDYISFLASRFCPIAGKNLSRAEKKLNKNWEKNVRYFLGES